MICQRGVRLPAPTAPGLKMRPTQRPAAGGGAFGSRKGALPPFTPAQPMLALCEMEGNLIQVGEYPPHSIARSLWEWNGTGHRRLLGLEQRYMLNMGLYL